FRRLRTRLLETWPVAPWLPLIRPDRRHTMSGRVFSVILLPTSECNVACDYCFEHKEPHRLSPALLPLLTKRLLDHLESERIEECEIYWQGGEAMIMGPAWFADAGEVMDQAAAKRGRRFVHYLQTNLISYSPAWNDVIHGMFKRVDWNLHGLPQRTPQTV